MGKFKDVDWRRSFAHSLFIHLFLTVLSTPNLIFASACSLNTSLVCFESYQRSRGQQLPEGGHQQDAEEHEEEIDAVSKSLSVLLRQQESSRCLNK